MISMMYLVLTAMLALNVSAEILNGYTLVEDTMKKSITIGEARNEMLQGQFESMAAQNAAKAKPFLDKANEVKIMSDNLYNEVSRIQKRIITIIDKDAADTANIQISDEGRGDLNVPSQVGMLEKEGEKLRLAIEDYRTKMQEVVAKDSTKVASLAEMFNTDKIENKKEPGVKKNWESGVFEDMPAVATLTVLSKIKNDIRNAQAEAVQYLMSEVDAGDFRVNKITALAIPKSSYVMRGGKYSAEIVLAAIDSTKALDTEVDGKTIVKNAEGKYVYEVPCSAVGNKKYNGKIKMKKPNGEEVVYDFVQEYTIGEPTATVSADMMNVLYAGFENPVSVSASGVPSNKISLSMTGGQLIAKGDGKYVARPAKVGEDVTFSVTGVVSGRTQSMGTYSFKVRKLPDPTAYIKMGDDQFRGGRISKADLLATNALSAAIDDGLLNIPFRVLGFEAVFFDRMGNAKPAISQGANFTEEQRSLIRELRRNQRFNISRVRAIGPDGIERTLPYALEVIIN
jgi:gliding motility-associated protein GldM